MAHKKTHLIGFFSAQLFASVVFTVGDSACSVRRLPTCLTIKPTPTGVPICSRLSANATNSIGNC
jgi:hypothetical protein